MTAPSRWKWGSRDNILDAILLLKQRMDNAEKQLKALTETPPPPVPATLTSIPESPAASLSESVRKECEEERVEAFIGAQDAAALQFTSRLTAEQLLKSIERREYVFCAPCNNLAMNPRQALIHFISYEHSEELMKLGPMRLSYFSIVTLVGYIVQKITRHIDNWSDEEKRLVRSQKCSTDPGTVPAALFVGQMQAKYALPIIEGVIAECGNSNPPFIKCIPAALSVLKGDLGARIIQEVNEHIGDRVTGCFDCQVVTGSRDAYYNHLIGSEHMKSISKSSNVDMITLAVNCHLKHLAKTTI